MISLFIFIIFISIDKKISYMISVIIPIYNVGRYLNDSINSLFNQTIGFENIQIILVNDGSLDQSKNICLEYSKKYKNIIYIETGHYGVSKARNVGLEYAKGEYINFLDADDTWDSKAFKSAYSYLNENQNLDIIAGRIKFFDASNEFHSLDYKFKITHIANLIKEYYSIQLSASSCFFRAKSIEGNKFDENISFGEDTLFINLILLKNPLIGYSNEIIYNYRRRFDGTSASQKSKNNDSFYFISTNEIYKKLISYSNQIYNKTLPFIQYSIAYEVLHRIMMPSYKYLNNQKYLKYIKIIENLLNQIDDKYIYTQRNINNIIKFLALSKKYHKDIKENITFEDGKFKFYNYTIINNPIRNLFINLKFIEIKDDILHLEGFDSCWFKREYYFYFCRIGNNYYMPKIENYEELGINTLYGKIKGRIIKFDIPLYGLNNQTVNFYITYRNYTLEFFIVLGWFSHIPPIENGYYISNGYILLNKNSHLVIFKETDSLKFQFEKNYCEQLKLKGKEYLIPIREMAIKNNKKRKDKEIWLICDRINQAGDNGEHFFRYLNKKKPTDIEPYFIIQQNCTDYRKLKDLKNIYSLDSNGYYELFLKADKIISSTSNFWISNPFGRDRHYIYDLFHFDHVFLQHGIAINDYSENINRYRTNFSLFITSSKGEYNSFLEPKYGYNSDIVKLTGLSRYDNLERLKNKIKKEKLILIIPTFRTNIRGTILPFTYESVYSELFKYTDYFKFFNNLINDNRLIEAMKKYNYKGIFSLHPCFSAQWKDFTPNSVFKILSNIDYQKMFLKASLLITDYSSIFFDFAYLKKLVILTQFDYEEFRKFQYKKANFDYIKDGLGPVCRDYESSLSTIIESLNNDCKLPDIYLRRINGFYSFFDKHNNDRIYQAIKQIGHPNKKHVYNRYIFIENFGLFTLILFLLKLFYKIKEYFFYEY